MRAALPLAVLAMAMPGAATAAPEVACPYVSEALGNTADVLLEVRKGSVSGNALVSLADASERAEYEMGVAAWKPAAVDAAGGMFALAAGAHNGGLDAAAVAKLLSLADIVVTETLAVCGAGYVPVFIRPGESDTRACTEVLKFARTVEQVLPTIAGKPDAIYPRPAIMMAVSEAKKARGQVEASLWSAASRAALDAVDAAALDLATSSAPLGPAAAAKIAVDARVVVDEGRGICGVYDFRDINFGS